MNTTSTATTLTVWGRLKGTSHLWLFFSLGLFLVALAALQLTALLKEISAAEPGFNIQRQLGAPLIGAHSDDAWPGLRSGDELISINGQPITIENFFDVRTALPLGPLTVVVKRDGVPLELHGHMEPRHLVATLALVVRWLTGLVLYVLAVGVFLLRPGAKVSWLFFLFLSDVGSLVLVGQGFPLPQSVLLGFYNLLYTTAPVAGFHFLANFPIQVKANRLIRPLYAVALGWWFVTLVIITSGRTSHEVSLQLAAMVRPFSIAVGMPMLWIVGHQWRSAVKQGNARLATITRTLTLAVYGGLFAPLVGNAVVHALGIDGGFAHHITAVSVLIFAVTTAMVLVRHNPLEIDRYAASVVGYVVTLGGLGGLFGFALLTLPLVLRRWGMATSPEALVVLTALTFISVRPVYGRLRQIIERWFSREQADALQTAEVLRHTAASVQNDSSEQSLSAIVEAALVIGPELTALWQIDASGASLHRVFWRHGKPKMPLVSREGPLEAALSKAGAVGGLGPTSLPAETQHALWDLDLVMTAPVRAHGVSVGFLGVGRRPSGFGYRSEDLSFLEALASQAGLALERGEVVTQIGSYRVEKRLAQGGMAEVFVASQLGPGGFERKVALKRLLPELAENPASAAGLLDEARITAQLQHPNIAQVYEVGLEAGQHFIAMEFIDGPPLRTLMANQKRAGQRTPLPVSLNVAQALLGALEHAHQLKDPAGRLLGVIHRDVTPSNVLVSQRGDPKLVDFGLVMATNRLFRTQTGVVRGTVPFMSPEQALHKNTIDLRTDIYSAGATLYELFCGERAFREGPKSAPPPPGVSQVNPELPTTLDAVFTRAFAHEPEHRFASAGAFLEAIRAATPGTPVADPKAMSAWVQRYGAQLDPGAKSSLEAPVATSSSA